MSIQLLLAVAGLAVLDTLSPTTIAGTIVVLLTAGTRSGRLLAVYWATIAVAYFALGIVLMLGLGAVFAVIDEVVILWAQAVVGAALLVGSFFIPSRPAEQAKERTTPRALSIGGMVVLGLGTWAFEAGTAVPYFAAIALMTAAGLVAAQWLSVLAAYVVIMIVPGMIVAAVWALARERVRPRFERWRVKLSTGSRTAVSWIVGIAGFFVLSDAAGQLLTEYGVDWLRLGGA